MERLPYCQRCGANIPPEEAIPYLDSYGQPIPGQFRNWCIYHWAQRPGALPINHPDFYKPIDARTKRRDKLVLSQRIGYAAMHGRSLERPGPPNYAQALPEELTKPQGPIKPNVFEVLRTAANSQSMFPEFEWVGNRIASLGPEEQEIVWEDYDATH